MDFTIRPARAHLVPLGDLPLRLGFPELLQLGSGDVVDPRVAGMDDDREAIVGHRQLDVLDRASRAEVHLGGLDRPGGIGDVDLARAELLESAAGPRYANSHSRVVSALEFLGHGFGDWKHGARSVDPDLATTVGLLLAIREQWQEQDERKEV